MKSLKNSGAIFKEGQQAEKAGKLEDAAVLYQRVVDADPRNRPAVERLLVMYRKLKEYRKELAVIDAALGAVQQREKTTQEQWIKEHPGAAKLGKAFLKTLGGESAGAYGTDPFVGKLEKRRAFVERRVSGKKGGGAAKKKKSDVKTAVKKAEKPAVARAAKEPVKKAVVRRIGGTDKKKKAVVRKMETAAERKKRQAAEKKKEKALKAEQARREKAARAAQVREEKAERVERARQAKEDKAEQARLEKAEKAEKLRQERAARAEQARQEKEAKALEKQRVKEEKAQVHLFVVSLRYLVGLDRIDAAMEKHVKFLDKHFKAGTFIVAGRQVPRTGGIIIARGKNREAIEKIMEQDPFIKNRQASFDMVEFVGSRVGKGWKV